MTKIERKKAVYQDWPVGGAARGGNLRVLLDMHKVTTQGFADLVGVDQQTVAMWVNGGHTSFGRDLLTRTSPENRLALLRSIAKLEPRWTDEDLWRWFGVPELLRGTFKMPDQDLVIEPLYVSGIISSSVPVRLRIEPDAPGFQVWRAGHGAAVLLEGHVLEGGVHLGALAGLEPLEMSVVLESQTLGRAPDAKADEKVRPKRGDKPGKVSQQVSRRQLSITHK